jgi:hypothetical protein
MEHFTYCQFDEIGPKLLTWPEQKPYFSGMNKVYGKQKTSVEVLS